jgi:long-subunit acyl-CoA synthetase (AMP-forming)
MFGYRSATIVLSNGENVEPQPLEDAILGGSGDWFEQVVLMRRNGRRLVAILVLSPTEFANLGYLRKSEAEKLQKAIEIVRDPKCGDYAADSKFLQKASEELRKNIHSQTTLDSAILCTVETNEYCLTNLGAVCLGKW